MLRDLAINMANEAIPITSQGKAIRVTKKEALLRAITNDALTGTPMHRLRALKALGEIGMFDIRPQRYASDAEARRKFLQTLAELAREENPDWDPDPDISRKAQE
jgi:hypothetical protein